MGPVALAMFAFALSMLEGAMPTAVKPYSWVGWTPVMATLLTAAFFLVRVSHLRALLAPAASRYCCLVVVRPLAEEVSTPMSCPEVSYFIGIPVS